jgi:hypothetical protein
MVRAEPVAALYEQGRVHHIGTVPQLEDQMTNFTSDIDRAAAGYSPDRVDALVWAFSELLVEPMNGKNIFEFYRQRAEAAAERSKPQPAQTVPQPGPMEWLAGAGEQGLNHQVVSFKSPADTPAMPGISRIHGFCAAVPEIRIHLPPAVSQRTFGSS